MAMLFSFWGCAIFSVGPEGEEFEKHAEECENTVFFFFFHIALLAQVSNFFIYTFQCVV